MGTSIKEKLNVLRSFAWVTTRGKFIGKFEDDACYENPTLTPMHIASHFKGFMYEGCGIWKDVDGNEFEFRNIADKFGGKYLSTHVDALLMYCIGERKSEGTIDLKELNDIMNEDAVIAVTDDGWKIVDMFAFKSVPWKMKGFNTYAYKDGEIKKCIIGYQDGITYKML